MRITTSGTASNAARCTWNIRPRPKAFTKTKGTDNEYQASRRPNDHRGVRAPDVPSRTAGTASACDSLAGRGRGQEEVQLGPGDVRGNRHRRRFPDRAEAAAARRLGCRSRLDGKRARRLGRTSAREGGRDSEAVARRQVSVLHLTGKRLRRTISAEARPPDVEGARRSLTVNWSHPVERLTQFYRVNPACPGLRNIVGGRP